MTLGDKVTVALAVQRVAPSTTATLFLWGPRQRHAEVESLVEQIVRPDRHRLVELAFVSPVDGLSTLAPPPSDRPRITVPPTTDGIRSIAAQMRTGDVLFIRGDDVDFRAWSMASSRLADEREAGSLQNVPLVIVGDRM